MSVSSATRDGILFIALDDPRLLEEARIEQVEKDIYKAIESSTEDRVVLDFTKVQFMSSSMLGKLVKVHKKCGEFKVKLKLSSVAPDILEVFKITRMNKLFDIEADAEAARKAFNKRGIFG
ncbi:MAG: STAS domain-containing protein [Lacipirellulaceae bacterium]